MDQQLPVVVGAGQLVQRDVEPALSLDPLTMLCQVARKAADDAGGGAALLERLDAIYLVDAVGWHPDNAPSLLAEALGSRATPFVSAPIGGETGLALINAAAERIASGQSRAAFIGGVHAWKSLRAAIAQGVRLAWPKGGRGALEMYGEPRAGETDLERRHGLQNPTEFYPVFENALRARRGREPEAHRVALGRLFSPMTRVAAQNPYAWFPVERSASELCAVSASNRMIAYPYSKYLNAVLDTDQAAGVLLLSVEAARAAGLPRERWMYWLGGGYAEERAWFVSERRDLAHSAALQACATRSLEAAGVSAGELDFIDFYSCFPVAVELACEAYGVPEHDPRGLTVTGGLPYAGGPGSNYTTHAVAAMLERLRASPGVGLCTGNGWYLTKHAAALFGSEPRALPEQRPLPEAVGAEPLPIAQEPAGGGRVEAYTLTYDREGAPNRGIVLGRLESGQRFIANLPKDRQLLEASATRELCGVQGHLHSRDGLGHFIPA